MVSGFIKKKFDDINEERKHYKTQVNDLDKQLRVELVVVSEKSVVEESYRTAVEIYLATGEISV